MYKQFRLLYESHSILELSILIYNNKVNTGGRNIPFVRVGHCEAGIEKKIRRIQRRGLVGR